MKKLTSKTILSLVIGLLLIGLATFSLPKMTVAADNEYIWIEAESGTIAGEWQIAEDAKASGGKYIVTAADKSGTPNPAQSIKFVFNVKADGKYKVFLRLLTLTEGESSIHLKMNGEANFRTEHGNQSEWYWNFLNNDNVDVPVNFNLKAGENTLVIFHREPDVRIDKLLITNDANLKVEGIEALKPPTTTVAPVAPTTQPTAPVTATAPTVAPVGPTTSGDGKYIWIEAESGTIAGEWQIKEDAACSGGKYIVTSADKSGTLNPQQGIKYVFNVPAAGKYRVYLRLLTLTEGETSVHVKMNNDANFRTEHGNSEVWFWNFLNNDNVDVPMTFNLVAGQNTLVIYHREPDVRIDKFLITSDTSLKVEAIDALK